MLGIEYTPDAFDIGIGIFLSDFTWDRATEARQECFMAGEQVEYTYGEGRGVRTYTSLPYHPTVLAIRDNLNASGLTFNVCFLNRYDDASQHLGWHADDSPGMDHNHPIAVVSFGQERPIWWRRKGESGVVPIDQRQMLGHGSLFVMPAGFQKHFQHRIPKGDRKMSVRVSLTFRHYIHENVERKHQ